MPTNWKAIVPSNKAAFVFLPEYNHPQGHE